MTAKRKNIIFIVLLAAVVIFALRFFRISSPEDYYSDKSPLWDGGAYVFLTVDCKTARDNFDLLDEELRDEKYVPEDGLIIPTQKISVSDGDTAYDVLIKAAKYYEIPLDIQGADENSFGTAYIRGINNLYEFSCGELSGWMYSVNGSFPAVGCDRMELSDGDEVRFVYTCELGEDVG